MKTWKEHLKDAGMADAQIVEAEKAFGAALLAKVIDGPIAAAEAALAAKATAETKYTEYKEFYEGTVQPKLGEVYTDAINMRSENARLKARLKAAQDYGFLAVDDKDDEAAAAKAQAAAAAAGASGVNPVPGSPSYVKSEDFSKAVNAIPDQLGRLTDMSNEHFYLTGEPLMGVQGMIDEARTQKVNVFDLWQKKYDIPAKREAKIAAKTAADREKLKGELRIEIASEAHNPLTRGAVVSSHSQFGTKADDRKPWVNSTVRREERKANAVKQWSQAAGAA